MVFTKKHNAVAARRFIDDLFHCAFTATFAVLLFIQFAEDGIFQYLYGILSHFSCAAGAGVSTIADFTYSMRRDVARLAWEA